MKPLDEIRKNPFSYSSGGIVWRKNKKGEAEVLLLHRFKTDHWNYDSWHLPKGTIKKGETKKETAKREIKEEAGYKIKVMRYTGSLKSTWKYKDITIYKTTYYYACKPIKKIISAIQEHDEVKWVAINEAIKRVSLFRLFEKEERILNKFKKSKIS